MAVYVDDMYAQYGRMKMSHMIADTPDELDAMADRIGVDRRWKQRAGTVFEHYDVSIGARAKAVKLGAIELTLRELAMKRREIERAAR